MCVLTFLIISYHKKKKATASLFLKNKHLLSRAGFGVSLENFKSLKESPTSGVWKELLAQSKEKTTNLSVGYVIMENQDNVKLLPEEKRALAKKNREMNMKLNSIWFQEMVNTKAQLREKMALFWHGHFATRIQNNDFNQGIIQNLRKKCTGKLR